MGKPIIAQRKGKGSPAYSSPGHRYFGHISYPENFSRIQNPIRGQVMSFIDDAGRGPLIAEILLENNQRFYTLAAEGQRIGDAITIGAGMATGCIVPFSQLPEGTPIFNIESKPSDGGKLARTEGSVAYVAAKDEEKRTVDVRLASRKLKSFSFDCLATIGVACGGGHMEKPFKKAGTHMFVMLARGREWPHVRRSAMSAYNHPFGGRSMGKPTAVSHNTPPGRKVGHIAARRTGRRRGRSRPEDGK